MIPTPIEVAESLCRLVDELKAQRDAGCPDAMSLHEQHIWRAGFNAALMLVGSDALLMLVMERGEDQAIIR